MRGKGVESLFEEIVTDNFAYMGKENTESPKEDEPQEVPRHIVIHIAKTKDKEKILKAVRERQTVPGKGNSIRLSADFSGTLEARREWPAIFKILKGKNLLYPVRLSFIIEGEIKSFPGK